MQLSYVISGAHWNASYDVRVVSGEKTIELTYYGVITNNSTDDWLNVSTTPWTLLRRVAWPILHLLDQRHFVDCQALSWRHSSRALHQVR